MELNASTRISEIMEKLMLFVHAGRFADVAKQVGWHCLLCDDDLTEFGGVVFTADMKPTPVCPACADGFKVKGHA